MSNAGWIGLDIGGANLKAADGQGRAVSQPFPLWKHPNGLTAAIDRLLQAFSSDASLAVTMTGELADCYATKREGVASILDAVQLAARNRATRVYLVDGRLVSLQVARAHPLLAAASNWHALAAFAGRYCQAPNGLLLDIGSTTCDVIPLRDGKPFAIGSSDPERMASGELVYTGVVRSPICAITSGLPCSGANRPIAQELFATSWDAYLLLGELPPEPSRTDTADTRPATPEFAHARMARMFCSDQEAMSFDDARRAAEHLRHCQVEMIASAVRQVIARSGAPSKILLAGQGEFLAQHVLRRLELTASVESLTDLLGSGLSQCAPAHAVAVLAGESEEA